MSVDISVEYRSICRPTYRSSIGRYVDFWFEQFLFRFSILMDIWAVFPVSKRPPPPPPPSMKRHILVYCGTHKKDEHVDCAVINIQENIIIFYCTWFVDLTSDSFVLQKSTKIPD